MPASHTREQLSHGCLPSSYPKVRWFSCPCGVLQQRALAQATKQRADDGNLTMEIGMETIEQEQRGVDRIAERRLQVDDRCAAALSIDTLATERWPQLPVPAATSASCSKVALSKYVWPR